MSKFTKQHYEAIAVLLADKVKQTRARGCNESLYQRDIEYIASFVHLFTNDSSRFDEERFINRINELSDSNIKS